MKEYFSSFFTIVESNNSIFSFVKLNGLSIISLLFEICLEVILIVILTTIKYFRIKKGS